MPYWVLILHDGAANLVSGYINGSVWLLESLGVSRDASVALVTGVTVAMIGGAGVWIWAKVRSALRRGSDAAREQLRRAAAARHPGLGPESPES
jgi:hypothetical protein